MAQASLCGDAVERLLPPPRASVLVVGADGSRLAQRLQARYPWMSFSGIACGALRDGLVSDESFSAVLVAQGLDLGERPNPLLARGYELLSQGGTLLACSDLHGAPAAGEQRETAIPSALTLRKSLESAGFGKVEVHESEFRGWGTTRGVRSGVALARAWKQPVAEYMRLDQLIRWVYCRLSPDVEHRSQEPLEILAGGCAWCAGYTAALGEALCREGFGVRWLTLIADHHPGGRGRKARETHEVLEVSCEDKVYVVDPMVGVSFAHTIGELICRPELASMKGEPDERYRTREYRLYASPFLYSRIGWVGWREDPQEPKRYRPARWVGRSIPSPVGGNPVAFVTDRPRARWERISRKAHNGIELLLLGGSRLVWWTFRDRHRVSG